jgi:branched-chain amino acid transport system substrate-binding protein
LLIEDIVKTIKNNIAIGKIGPGDKLPTVKELQKKYDVGRGTVREALKIMEGMGLLVIKKGRGGGAFLKSQSNQIVSRSLSDLFTVEESNILSYLKFRKTLEPGIIRSACLNREHYDLEKIKAALDLISAQTITREVFIEGTSGLFRAIFSATQNEHLNSLFEFTLSGLIETSKLLYEIPLCVELSEHFYVQIYQAILNKDPEKGTMLSEGYLLQLEDKVRSAKSQAKRSYKDDKVIKWGFMADLSGTLMDYGKQCAMGMMDAARYINENGGINGKKIEIIVFDDKYDVSLSQKAFDKFKDSNVTGIYMMSTGAVQSLMSQATRDQVFLFTSATSTDLLNPKIAPYHFTLGPTYGDMSRAAIKYIRMKWEKIDRPPKLVFMFPDNPYGKENLKGAKTYAEELNVEIGPNQIVGWPTLDATEQLRAIKNEKPDYVLIASSAINAANILKDAKRLRVESKFICNLRVFTEDLPKFAMDAAEGVLGIQPFAPFGIDVPGMEKIIKYHNMWHPFHQPTLVYVEGWLNMLIPMDAYRMADQAGDISSEGLKAALESFRDYDTGSLIPPISYYEYDHRSTTQTKIYRIDNGEMIPVTDYIDVGR